MKTRRPSRFVPTAFAAAIVTLLTGGAGAQQCALPQNCTVSSGNVGIGTTSPGRTLDVEGPIVAANGSSAFLVGADTGGAASFWTNASYNRGSPFSGWVQTLNMKGGNVGVGTTNPQARLDVAGIAQIGALAFRGGQFLQQWLLGVGVSPPANLEFRTSIFAPAIMSLTLQGNVGIGTTNPQAQLDVAGLARTGTLEVAGIARTGTLQITGGSDLSEHFEVRDAVDIKSAAPPIQAGLVVSIDPGEPGKLAISSQAYDHKVAGIISGAGGVRPGMLMSQSGSMADGDHPLALTGRVYCWADASYGPIAPGDLLTTSDTPGHAMRVTDYAKAQGAVLGKAMAALKQGKGLVLTLVTLQ